MDLIKSPGATYPDSQFKKAYEFFRRRLRDQAPDDACDIDPKEALTDTLRVG